MKAPGPRTNNSKIKRLKLYINSPDEIRITINPSLNIVSSDKRILVTNEVDVDNSISSKSVCVSNAKIW
jgi:hypothetical protein